MDGRYESDFVPLGFGKPLNITFKNVKDTDLVKRIRQKVGIPARADAQVSRLDLNISDSDSDSIHIDIGGEGKNEHMGYISGFESSINVNATEYQSNGYKIRVPNLIKIASWDTDPSYPFADGFADYITMQNAPLTTKNVDEIARCLRPGGQVDLWVYGFEDEIEALAKKLESKPEYQAEDEFKGSTGNVKTKIVSGIKKPSAAVTTTESTKPASPQVSVATHPNRFEFVSPKNDREFQSKELAKISDLSLKVS